MAKADNDGDDYEDEMVTMMMMMMRRSGAYRVEVRMVALVATQAESPPIMTAAQCTPRLQSARKAAAALEESHNWSDRILSVKVILPQPYSSLAHFCFPMSIGHHSD